MVMPEGVYHVTARGNGDERIFADDADKLHMIRLLAAASARQGWDIMAYCLMDNHYHLVVRTPVRNLSEGMHMINASYGEAYNARHEHRGHVFQGRVFSVAFASDAHLLEACRYTVLNPVRAGLVTSPADWQWSSYGASAFGRASLIPLSDQMLLSMVDDRGGDQARASYREFISAGIGLPKPAFLMPRREGRPASPHVLRREPLRSRGDVDLEAGILRLRSQGKTLREIGHELGVSAMTVERHLKETTAPRSL
jgi:REP element-mobilizing transposase RayT